MSPVKGWHRNPLNMVNYYALGRHAWDFDIPVGQIYSEWIGMTFSKDEEVVNSVKKILYQSDDVGRNLGFYRGYRGLTWSFKYDQKTMAGEAQKVDKKGMGLYAFEDDIMEQYSPLAQEFFSDKIQAEKWLPYFH